MCPGKFQEKMDVLDLIISVLKEHEETLGNLADKFESMISNLYAVESKISSLNETFTRLMFSKTLNTPNLTKPATLVQCKEWAEFRGRSNGARMVAFEVEEKVFTVSSERDGVVFRYSEFLPELRFQTGEGPKRSIVEKMSFDSLGDLSPVFERRLKCGLEIVVKGSKFDLSNGEHLFQLKYQVDPDRAKIWLSEELEVPEGKVIEGKLAYSSL